MSNHLSVMTKFVNPLSSNTMLRNCKGVYTTPNFYWSVGCYLCRTRDSHDKL